MEKYKISGDGVIDTETGACIPNSDDNTDWRKYQEWLSGGNTPDPEFTPEEEAQNAIKSEIADLRRDLKKVLIGQFEMILAMFEAGKANGVWFNTDFEQSLRQKAAAWKQKLDRLRELGDDD